MDMDLTSGYHPISNLRNLLNISGITDLVYISANCRVVSIFLTSIWLGFKCEQNQCTLES